MNTKRALTRNLWLAWPLLVLTVSVVGVVSLLWDAEKRRKRRSESQAEVRAMVRLLGTADLALSSSSRWLRHPSLSEPGAAFADGPALLDNDPAGAWLGPPRAVLSGMGTKKDQEER